MAWAAENFKARQCAVLRAVCLQAYGEATVSCQHLRAKQDNYAAMFARPGCHLVCRFRGPWCEFRCNMNECVYDMCDPQGLSFDHRGASLETVVRVSWMGVWKGPTSPCYRRLDIKTYERAALPYAVNYFSSGQDGSRALRCACPLHIHTATQS